MSRHQAQKVARGRAIIQELADKGIVVRGAGRGTIDEEISEAYKDVAMVWTWATAPGSPRRWPS